MTVVEATLSQSPSQKDIDTLLVAQFAVAWAGEGGEEPRLGWWRCDLISEFGGEDLFQRLLPDTWEWAVFQGAREAARRRDAELRRQDHDPDRILTLFNLGFELNEQVNERLAELKRSGTSPAQALPGLTEVVTKEWDKEHFGAWVQSRSGREHTAAPVGRRLKGDAPVTLDELVETLVAACWPLADAYPMPHYRRSL